MQVSVLIFADDMHLFALFVLARRRGPSKELSVLISMKT